MMQEKYTLTLVDDGRIMLRNDIGQQFLLDDDVLFTIWQHYDRALIKKKLLNDSVVTDDPENISAIETLTDYYIEKRNEILEVLHHPVFLSYAFSELDADDWEAERERYEVMLGYMDEAPVDEK